MLTHVIEKQQKADRFLSVCGQKDTTASGLNVSVWSPKSWEIHRVSLNFSGSDAKAFSIGTERGIGIVTGYNDRLWLKMDGVAAQPVILPEGFYNSTTMSSAIKAALDSSALPAASKPFSVSYVTGPGKFRITPATGNIKFFSENITTRVRRDSTAGNSIGFTVNSDHTTPIESDTGVFGINTQIFYTSGTASAALNVVSTDIVAMTVDDAFVINTTVVPVNVTYEVVYKILDA